MTSTQLRQQAWRDTTAGRPHQPVPEAKDLDRGADGPAALAREARVVTIEGRAKGSAASERITVRRYRDECQVDSLNTRGQIGDRLWRAGMFFRGAWLTSVQMSRVCATYSAHSPGGHGDDLPVRRIEARRRVNEALAALPSGPEQAAVVGVCGMDEPCAGRLRALQAALETLARHYDIEADYCRGYVRRR